MISMDIKTMILILTNQHTVLKGHPCF